MDGRLAAGDLAPAGDTRHEVEATVPYAVVEGPEGPPPGRFLFYHEAAVGGDLEGLWAYCRFCVSRLAWVHDHFEVTPNPRYLLPAPAGAPRLERVVTVLRNYFRAKALVQRLDWPA